MISAHVTNCSVQGAESTLAVRRRLAVVATLNGFIGATALIAPALGLLPDAGVHASWVVCSALACGIPLMSRGVIRRIPTQPAVTLVAAYCIYFVGGAAVPLAGGHNPDLQDLMRQFGATWNVVLECDAMNSIGLAVALSAVVMLPCRCAGAIAGLGAGLTGRVKAPSVAAAFLAIGALAYLPMAGLLSWRYGTGGSPGGQVLWRLGAVFDCGILLAILTARRGQSLLPVAAVFLGALQCIMGILATSKSESLTPVAMILIAWFARRPNFWRLASVAVVASSLYLIASGMATRLRHLADDDANQLSRRITLAFSAMSDRRPFGDTFDGWISLNRLCYLPAQARAVALHRSGEGDAFYADIPWLLVPRGIYPEKPRLSERGERVAEQMSGQWGSSASPTIFVDGYFQLGWPGVLLVGLIAGWIVRVFGALSQVWLRRRAFVFLPLVVYGHFIAFRIDGVALGPGDHLFGLILVFTIAFAIVVLSRRHPKSYPLFKPR